MPFSRRPVWVTLFCLVSMACGGPEPPPFPNTGHGDAVSATSSSSRESILVIATPSPPLILTAKLTYGEDRFSKISSPLPGRIQDVRVKLGDSVKAGDVLLTMDSPDIALAYTDYVKEIAELSLAKRNYELTKDLFAVQAISIKEYKQAENDLRREQAEFKQAKERLLTLRVPSAELDKPLSEQAISSRFELKSPLTGSIVERNVTPGQLVANDPGQVLFTVADLETLQVVADLYERDLALLESRQSARVTVDAYANIDFPATVAVIGDVVDPTSRTIKVRAWVHNEGRRLKPEMFGRLIISLGGEESLVIPAEAVIEAGGQTVVYVKGSEDRYEQRVVTVEPLSRERVRVMTGLMPGEHIAKTAAQLKGRVFSLAGS